MVKITVPSSSARKTIKVTGSNQEKVDVQRFANSPLDDLSDMIITTPVSNSSILTYNTDEGTWKNVPAPVDLVVFYPGNLPPTTSNTQLAIIVEVPMPRKVDFSDNFSGSIGKVRSNPNTTVTIHVMKNDANVGFININSSGVFSFTNTGNVSFSSNSKLGLIVDTYEENISDISITLTGSKG
jgi:hypothetical protein